MIPTDPRQSPPRSSGPFVPAAVLFFGALCSAIYAAWGYAHDTRQWLDAVAPRGMSLIEYHALIPQALLRRHSAGLDFAWSNLAPAGLAILLVLSLVGWVLACTALMKRLSGDLLPRSFGAGVAIVLVGLGMLCGGFVVGLHVTALCLLVVGLLLHLWYGWETWMQHRHAGMPRLRVGLPSWDRVVLGIVITPTFLYALTPAIESDGLRYHLGALSEWAKADAPVFLPHLSFASFPFLIEMLFALTTPWMLSDAIAAGIAAKLMHHLLFVLSLVILRDLAREIPAHETPQAADRCAAVASAMYALTPVAAILSGWSFIDHGIVFFFLLLIQCTHRYLHAIDLRSMLVLAAACGVAAGGLLGTKYTMLLPVGVAGLLMLLLNRAPMPRRLATVALMGAVVLLVGGPWFVKNIVQAGNPVYPARAGGLLPTPGWTEEAAELLSNQMKMKGTLALPGTEERLEIPAWQLPVALSRHWGAFEAQFPALMPILGTLAILCALVAMVAARQVPRRALLAVGIQAILFLVAWWFTYRSTRLLLPVLALAALPVGCLWATAWGQAQQSAHGPRLRQRAAILLVAGALGLHGVVGAVFTLHWWLLGQTPAPLPVALGFKAPEVYLAGSVNYYAAARDLNQRQRETGGGALLIGEHRPYYFEEDIHFADWFNPPVVIELLDRHDSPHELIEGLRSKGMRYVLINHEELGLYYRSVFVERLGPERTRRFEELLGMLESHAKALPMPTRLFLEQRADVGPRRILLYDLGPQE